MDYITLGSTPISETCQQIGSPTFDPIKSTKELMAYKHQLQRMFQNIPEGCNFYVRTFKHDFDSYKEVCINYNDEVKAASDYAYNVEENLPENWDEDALKELAETESDRTPVQDKFTDPTKFLMKG